MPSALSTPASGWMRILRDAQFRGHRAGVLRAGSAEGDQHVVARVVALGDEMLRIAWAMLALAMRTKPAASSRVRSGTRERPGCEWSVPATIAIGWLDGRPLGRLLGHLRQPPLDRGAVERKRKMLGQDAAEDQSCSR